MEIMNKRFFILLVLFLHLISVYALNLDDCIIISNKTMKKFSVSDSRKKFLTILIKKQ